jgi:hypothetical protein
MTQLYSHALYLEFLFDQTMENLLRGRVHAFWDVQPRVILSKEPCWNAAEIRFCFTRGPSS